MKKKLNLPVMGIMGAIAGGAVAGFIPKVLKSEDANSFLNNSYARAGAAVVAGAALQVFGKSNELLKGVGDGMMGVGGAMLAGEFMSDYPVKVGSLPSQRAIGALPSQRAIGAARWVDPKTVRVPVKPSTKNVQ